MKSPARTLANAATIYCHPGESLWQLSPTMMEEAIQFAVANDVSAARAAKAFRVRQWRVDKIRESIRK